MKLLYSFIAALAVAGTVVAAPRPLTVEDYATMPALSSPRFSPNGRRLVYVVTRADLVRSVYDSDLWLVDVDGHNDIQLTRGAGADYHPRWSPDGAWIAFFSDREGRTAIWLISSAGGEAVKLTLEQGAVREMEWSPDGRSIAFTMTDPPTAEEERRIKEREDVRVVGESRRQSHLYVISVDDRSVRRLTRGDFSINTISWSPDGRLLAVERMPGGGLDDLYRTDLYTIAADGRCDEKKCPDMEALVVRPGVDRMPRFSPDGKHVAFLSSGGVFDWLREHELWVVDLPSHNTHLISHAYGRTPDDFAWTGDARYVYFDGPLDTTSHIFRVTSDGTAMRQVSTGDVVIDDSAFDATSERVAFIQQSLVQPPELYISNTGGIFAPRQLTHQNDAYRTAQLGETRVIRWKNPQDGLEIEGLLTLPIGYSAGKKVPLLTFVHGGPGSRFDQGFLGYLGSLYAPQVLAANGFAVLRPNPRGTGGYGEKFRQGNRGDWGGMDWVDINAGIDSVIGAGIADPNRLGLMGWSYGGFIASWAISHSTRLKAISIGAPVVDLLSFHGTSDIRDFIPSYFPPADIPAPPPATQQTDGSTLVAMRRLPLSLEVLRDHSPLWHLRKTTAPVLIQHGEADDRVPLTQGTMLYRFLDELGVDVTMVTYPRSGHVPREPKQRIDVARRNLEFFKKNVK
ncbi:MAG: peptidase prolyl oligopeptidase active site domain protein [Acidobacteria bacterium]|nr:peptidase prolyl oligopeptidase active site domain protein [Acidobacteriota bacterium]